METITILPETTKNPITLMGARAGVCWGANVSDDEKIISVVLIVLSQVMGVSWNLSM